jgi:deazaflavin-dependent oxidoreductase (nitroreductase family)
MVGSLLTLAGVLILVCGALGATFVLGMRAKSPLVVGVVVGASKRWLNPQQLRTAGTPGAYAGVIHHRGRRSGSAYATPVGVVEADGAFLIALPYGTRTQWSRNVLAAGSAELTVEGRTWAVDQPELVPTDAVIDAFGPQDRRMFRLLHTDRCLRLHRVRELAAAA